MKEPQVTTSQELVKNVTLLSRPLNNDEVMLLETCHSSCVVIRSTETHIMWEVMFQAKFSSWKSSLIMPGNGNSYDGLERCGMLKILWEHSEIKRTCENQTNIVGRVMLICKKFSLPLELRETKINIIMKIFPLKLGRAMLFCVKEFVI